MSLNFVRTFATTLGLLTTSAWLVSPNLAQEGGAPAPNTLSDEERADGWQLLFDGETTNGWKGFRKAAFPEKGWVVEDGALRHVAGAGGGDVMPVERYRDFDLRFEWKVAPGANSGIMVRCSEAFGAPWQTGPEYQVLDDAKHADGRNPKTSAAALYALLPAADKELMPVGSWNTGRIVLRGHALEHWLNGKKVVETQIGNDAWDRLVAGSKFKSHERFGRESEGFLVFQDHGDDVWYRNLKVKRLAVLPEELGAEVALFDGRSLAGWEGFHHGGTKLEDVWKVEDGLLVTAGRPAGYVYTTDEYTNYVLHVRWRFDPVTKQGGNGGVLLRRVGEHKVWPKSIEAQLHAGHAGDIWNIDRFPMQVEASRTSGRRTRHTHGNEHPLGAWNDYRIVMNGGHLVLEVNGQVVNEAYGCEEVAGNICLQAEGAAIQFERIALRPILSAAR